MRSSTQNKGTKNNKDQKLKSPAMVIYKEASNSFFSKFLSEVKLAILLRAKRRNKLEATLLLSVKIMGTMTTKHANISMEYEFICVREFFRMIKFIINIEKNKPSNKKTLSAISVVPSVSLALK